jgi:hypothetical protein
MATLPVLTEVEMGIDVLAFMNGCKLRIIPINAIMLHLKCLATFIKNEGNSTAKHKPHQRKRLLLANLFHPLVLLCFKETSGL